MAGIKLTNFIGEIPKRIPRLLPETASQSSFNCRLTSGGYEPIRDNVLTHEFVSPPDPNDASIYRHNGSWYIFDGIANAIPAPIASDRFYVTSESDTPKMYSSGTEYDLKITLPSAALTLSKTGSGTGQQYTRLYVYTFVTSFGEETKPSPISAEITWQDGETVTLAGFEAGDAARGVTLQRIYRSQTGPNGTQLYFIAERSTTTSDYVDTIDVTDIGEPIPSTYWDNPIDTLEGLTTLPNGMMAAFSGKTLYFCEPYQPHAWPEIYALYVDFNIVGLGAIGNTLVVATEGLPYTVIGTHPENMILRKEEVNLPCVAKRSVVDLGYAVAYASIDGLVIVDSAGARIASKNLFSQDDWAELTPSNFACGHANGWYFVSYSYNDYNGVLQQGTFYIDLSGEYPWLVRSNFLTRSFWYEVTSGKLFFYNESNVYEWDGTGGIRKQGSWTSKDFIFRKPVNLGAIYVSSGEALNLTEIGIIEAEAAAVTAANEALIASGDIGGYVGGYVGEFFLAGDSLSELPTVDQNVSINIFADNELKESISDLNQVKRLPGGYLSKQYKIEISSNIKIEQIEIAETAKGLSQL